jgi:hypothetical protein
MAFTARIYTKLVTKYILFKSDEKCIGLKKSKISFRSELRYFLHCPYFRETQNC